MLVICSTVWRDKRPMLEFKTPRHHSTLRNALTSTRSTGIFKTSIFISHHLREYLSTKETKIFSNQLIQHQKRELLLSSTNGTWKELSTTGLPDTANSQEVSTSQRASTQSATWISEMVSSRDFTTVSTEKSPPPTSSPLHQPMPIGSLVTTESQTGNMNTEICDD